MSEELEGFSAPSDEGRAGLATPQAPAGLGHPETIPSAKAFVSNALMVRVAEMLVELDHPPLVDRIFPKGWQSGTYDDLVNLYELCRRTLIKRAKADG